MTYTLTGRYTLGDLTGRESARLRFTPSTTVVGDGSIILPAPVEVVLDTAGEFSVDLVGTDDTDYAPSGWVWTVTEMMPGGRAPWSFELTADSDLADVTVVVTPPEYDRFTLTVADTITGDPGTDADVTITGTPPGQALEFTIPRGTIVTVGDTITGLPGTDASVADVDAGVDVELEFTIPAPQTVLNGTTAPGSGLGNDGDFYIDTATSNLYGPKAAGAWPAPVSLVGAPSSLYDAHTILAATVDNTPAPVTVAEQRIVGRKTGGNIAALTGPEVLAIASVVVSRPNTDDVKVTVAGQTVWADTGWRQVASWGTDGVITASGITIGAALTAKAATAGWVRVRRTMNTVEWQILGAAISGAGTTSIASIPAGFQGGLRMAPFSHNGGIGNANIAATAIYCTASTGDANYAATIRHNTDNAWPTSIPGVLVSAAPA